MLCYHENDRLALKGVELDPQMCFPAADNYEVICCNRGQPHQPCRSYYWTPKEQNLVWISFKYVLIIRPMTVSDTECICAVIKIALGLKDFLY